MDRITFARSLRQAQTPAEAKLWKALRNGQLDGLKFRRQHDISLYVVDFACEALKLVVELDGGVHRDEAQVVKDLHRQQDLEQMGWAVLRFENAQVTGRMGEVLEAIRAYARGVRG
ncbi:endonuclease domain-containing protein [Brevundimonas sp. Leaf363]|uniref:endonuclease domain-containing protein n=1 Tax=Brevundimonas sp. Leaf363 TaxID=1736353 RepID=UPI000B27C500|nr:endonuclease domain-containing protein [Brevundimonas sp. Leaf363]